MSIQGQLLNLAGPLVAAAAWGGKAAFIGVFASLVLLLLLIPASVLGEAERRVPAWRNVRWWAILIAVAQIVIYAWLG
jgi:hypothetical protein